MSIKAGPLGKQFCSPVPGSTRVAFADTEDELKAFALGLGWKEVKMCQQGGVMPHYHLTPTLSKKLSDEGVVTLVKGEEVGAERERRYKKRIPIG